MFDSLEVKETVIIAVVASVGGGIILAVRLRKKLIVLETYILIRERLHSLELNADKA